MVKEVEEEGWGYSKVRLNKFRGRGREEGGGRGGRRREGRRVRKRKVGADLGGDGEQQNN